MELIASSVLLTFFLLLGALLDFLVTPSARSNMYQRDHFWGEPNRNTVVYRSRDRLTEYERAA